MRATVGRVLIRLGQRLAGSDAAVAAPPAPTPPPVPVFSPENEAQPASAEDARRQVRQLIRRALETPTAEEFTDFLAFTTRFRRIGVWNARLVHIQCRGATAVATVAEWKAVERDVAPDAVPIIILWPFGPIRFLYELADTLPAINRETLGDPFAVAGRFDSQALSHLKAGLARAKAFQVKLELRRLGYGNAGSAAAHGMTATTQEVTISGEGAIWKVAAVRASAATDPERPNIPSYRVTLNDRLTDKEQFVTLAHELGHVFCGHLGACLSHRTRDDDEGGWPDRSPLDKNVKEIEAEAVAYVVSARAGLTAASASYLSEFAKKVDPAAVHLDLIIRAAARIERLAKIKYGKMVFSPPRQEE